MIIFLLLFYSFSSFAQNSPEKEACLKQVEKEVEKKCLQECPSKCQKVDSRLFKEMTDQSCEKNCPAHCKMPENNSTLQDSPIKTEAHKDYLKKAPQCDDK